MFDVGFSEMIVIAIVALVVLGPEKLPKIARTVGKFYGSMQRYMSGFKADIEREVALDNMRKATAEAQQKLLELQSQVQVLSGEIPELAAHAQGTVVFDTPSDGATQKSSAAPNGASDVPAQAANSGVADIAADSQAHISPAADAGGQSNIEQHGEEGEELWKKKA